MKFKFFKWLINSQLIISNLSSYGDYTLQGEVRNVEGQDWCDATVCLITPCATVCKKRGLHCAGVAVANCHVIVQSTAPYGPGVVENDCGGTARETWLVASCGHKLTVGIF